MHSANRRTKAQFGLLFASLVAAGLLAGCATAPPRYALESAPRVAARPDSPHPHAVWVDGHYAYEEGRYVWVPGHWKR